MLGNREIMAENIKHYMDQKKVTASEICSSLGIKTNTFSDWVNAKSYPRIDKIEMMANYFGITKSMLVEKYNDDVKNLSSEELNLIDLYRKASAEDKAYFRRMLSYVTKMKELTNDKENKK